MATANDNRGRRQTSRDRKAQRRPSQDRRSKGACSLKEPSEPALKDALIHIERSLRIAHATAVTAYLALRSDGIEHGPDIARCLQWDVADVLSSQCNALHALTTSLGFQNAAAQPPASGLSPLRNPSAESSAEQVS